MNFFFPFSFAPDFNSPTLKLAQVPASLYCKLPLDVGVPNQDDQVDTNIYKDYSHVDVANTVASFGFGHVVCEMEMTVSDGQDCQLVHDLKPVCQG